MEQCSSSAQRSGLLDNLTPQGVKTESINSVFLFQTTSDFFFGWWSEDLPAAGNNSKVYQQRFESKILL